MGDEHSDRVYAPGTPSVPPARDVEPFWSDEELEAPVVPHEAPIAHQPPPGAEVEPGVFRPGPPMPQPGPQVPPMAHPMPQVPPPMPPMAQPVQQFAPVAQPVPQVPRPAPPTTQPAPPVAPVAPPVPVAQPVPQMPQMPPVALPAVHVPESRPTVEPPAADLSAPERPAPPVRDLSAPDRPEQPGPAAEPDHGPDSPWAQPPNRTPQPAFTEAEVPPPPTMTSQTGGTVYRATPAPEFPAPNTPAFEDPPQSPADPGCGPFVEQQAPSPMPPPVPSPMPPAPWPAPAPGPMPGPAPAPQPGPAPSPDDPFQELAWMADGTPTAEEFARRRLAKPVQSTASMGPRALLQKGTFGLVKLPPSRHELEFKQDVDRVRRNFGGLRQVTVVNPKGGAGKTVAVLLLAMTFGQKRGGYVLAWDNNETQGTLGMRAQQDFHARTVRDMMRDLHLFQGAQGRVGDLSQYVRAQGEGMFDVLASDESATAGEMLTADAFAEIREIVSRFYKLIFVDTGNNVRAQNWQAAMDATDQLVITMSARNDSAETAARALDHLEQTGRRRLVRQAVSVVTMPPTRKDIDLDGIQRHFAARTRAVLLAPYEKLIDSGEPIRYGALSNGTKDAWLKIAAAVAEGL